MRQRAGGGRSVAGFSMVMASAAGFAVMPVLVKLAYRSGSSVWNVLAFRFLLAAVILCLLGAVKGERRASPVVAIEASSFVLGSIFVLTSLSMFLALRYVPAGMASFLFYTYPALVTASAVVFANERLTLVRMSTIALTAAGCLLMFRVSYEDFAVGGLFALLSAASYTAYILIGDRVARSAAPLTIATRVVIVAAGWFLVAAVIAGDLKLPGSWGARASVVGIGVLSTSFALYAFLEGVKRIGASTAALVSTIEPVVTIALAWIVLEETLVPAQYVGAALILLAIATVRTEHAASVNAEMAAS